MPLLITFAFSIGGIIIYYARPRVAFAFGIMLIFTIVLSIWCLRKWNQGMRELYLYSQTTRPATATSPAPHENSHSSENHMESEPTTKNSATQEGADGENNKR